MAQNSATWVDTGHLEAIQGLRLQQSNDSAEAERKASQLGVPKSYGYPDVYVNGDVTVTVDPIKNEHWIRDDGQAWRFPASRHRGALKDHAGVMRAAAAWDVPPPPEVTFIPTVRHFESSPINMNLFTGNCVGNSSRGMREVVPDGRLPAHSNLIYKGLLTGQADWAVKQALYMENTHLDRSRAFDCGGMCR